MILWLFAVMLGLVTPVWATEPISLRDQCLVDRYLQRVFEEASSDRLPEIEEDFRRNMSEDFRASVRELYEAQVREGAPDVCPDEV